ncbi:MAG: hypothetical protein IPL79_02185 [Myxococcales bacterium]|nr:hypothetical protein [Myxococcales bacterium]
MFDPATEEVFLGIAHALFMNRLHVLRLTEVVRLRISPHQEDGNLEVPKDLDRELVQQSTAYVLKCFPASMEKKIRFAQEEWLRLS